MTITEQVLSKEDYVAVNPLWKDLIEYKIAYLIKEECRRHAWLENEKGRGLTWQQARDEWLKDHYQDFINFTKANLKPRKKRRATISDKLNYSFERRRPMISGHVV